MQITVKTQSEPSMIAENQSPDASLITYFGLNPSDLSKDDVLKINEIKSYLKESGEDEFKQFEELRNIRRRLGSPNVSTTEIEHIHRYIRLNQALRETQARVEEMEQ